MSKLHTGLATPPRVLAIVQAGGQGSRMDVLTRERAKPALSWGGTHQLIDFTLSNLAHSGIADVWVSVQYLASSLDEHLQGGRPWDLDRSRGGYRRVIPEEGGGRTRGGYASGNADNLFRMRDEITRAGHDLVVVASADHVFRCDLRPVLAAHVEAGADCTIITAAVSASEARHKLVVHTTGRGRRLVDGVVRAHSVSEVEEKPSTAASSRVAIEVFVYSRETLVAALDRLHLRMAEQGEDGLGDFGEHLLPMMVADGRTIAVPLDGYWKDVGRPQAYLQSHRDLVRGRIDVFDDPEWPIMTNSLWPRPARVRDGADVADSIIGWGADVRGEVVRSVIGQGVVIERGARVVDSVLLDSVQVQRGAVVETAVVDARTVVGVDARVGTLHRGRLSDSAIVLVGRDCVIAPGTVLERGARLEPGTTT